MKISIAMATYNGEKYLLEQLQSLSNQKHLPYELVVCDDKSQDNTITLLRNFKAIAPFPVLIYQNTQQLGYADNFLQAASYCKGDYIAFCDQDDVWLDNKLLRIQTILANYSDIVCIIHQGKIVNQELKPRLDTIDSVPNIKKLTIQTQARPDRFDFIGFAMVFARKVIQNYSWQTRPLVPSLWMTQRKTTHDLWIYFLSTAIGKVIYLAENLVLYRRHASNASDINPYLKLSTKNQITSIEYYKEVALYFDQCSTLLQQFKLFKESKIYQKYTIICQAQYNYFIADTYRQKIYYSFLKIYASLRFYMSYGFIIGFLAFLKEFIKYFLKKL